MPQCEFSNYELVIIRLSLLERIHNFEEFAQRNPEHNASVLNGIEALKDLSEKVGNIIDETGAKSGS